MKVCIRCHKEYDENAFMVKLKNGFVCQSALCLKCAKEDGGVEIIGRMGEGEEMKNED